MRTPAPQEGLAWTARAGAWLGIGANPAALAMGAGLADRHDGPVPLLVFLLGGTIAAALLLGQGLLGLRPATGEDGDFNTVAGRYVSPRTHRAVSTAIALAMIGWFGFNVGLAGAALNTLLGLADAVGPLLFAAPLFVLALGGIRRWNVVAVLATSSAVALTVLALAWFGSPAPVTTAPGAPPSLLADTAILVGYVAVFSVRSPDFSVGLAGVGQLGRCVALLVGSLLLFGVAGAGLRLSTGSADIAGLLAAGDGIAVANLLVALALVAPTFTAIHSGGLALRHSARLPLWVATLAITLCGTLLAALRFDRLLLPWLAILASGLPPIIVPFAYERLRRRRGREPSLVPLWTWGPAAGVAVVLTLGGVIIAPLAGLLGAVVGSAVWARMRRQDRRGS